MNSKHYPVITQLRYNTELNRAANGGILIRTRCSLHTSQSRA